LDQCRLFILTFFILFLVTDVSHAAGMLMRVQQMKAMKQRKAQGLTQEQYQQYQEFQEQQQGDHQAPAPLTYQQLVDQRNQAISQAILNAHSQSVSSGDAQGSSNQTASPVQSPAVTSTVSQQVAPAVSPGSTNVQDVVDLAEVWKKLDKKSTVWTLLIDDQSKLLTVSEYINRFGNEGVKIKEPPTHYVQMIDQVSVSNPGILQRPFGELIQTLAIIDYDFDNGMDKDALARQILGEAGFEQNKKRFTQQ